MGLEAIIPHMTTNNTPSPFIVSASNQLATYAPFNAFQDNEGSWISDVANSTIQVNLGRLYKIEKVFIDTNSSWTGAKMKSLTLQGSKNGTDWDDLYIGNTTDYKYTATKYFGVYQYVRIRSGSMTMRGGCVRYFQLYGSPQGFVDLDVNNIWVTAEPVKLSGSVYATNGKANVRVLINDEVADDWHLFEGINAVEYEYNPSLFSNGGNIIKVQMAHEDGSTTEETYLLYKLDFETYKFNTSGYDFKIHNSPLRPSQDGWLYQQYDMDYLNSELGVSYVFRFKPYAQVDSRFEDRPRLFDRILKENYNIESQIIMSDRRQGRQGIVVKSDQANISRLLDTIKSDMFKIALKEVGVIQRVFDSWAAINTESIGLAYDLKNSAEKKLKASRDILKDHRLNARRKEMIQNALTMIQGYELSTKKVFDTVMEYYVAMQDFYPYQETILAGLLINASTKENIAVPYQSINSGRKDTTVVQSGVEYVNADKAIGVGIVGSYYNSERVYDMDGVIQTILLSEKEDHTNTYRYDLSSSYANKEDMYGTGYSLGLGETEDGTGTIYDMLLGNKEENKEAHGIEVKLVEKNVDSKEGLMLDLVLVNKNQEGKEFRVDGIQFIDSMNQEALIEELREYIDAMPIDAIDKPMLTFINKMNVDSMPINVQTGFETMDIDAWLYDDTLHTVSKLNKEMMILTLDQYIDKLGKDIRVIANDNYVDTMGISSRVLSDASKKIDKLSKDMRIDESVMFILKTESKQGRPIFEDFFFDKGGREVAPLISQSFIEKINREVYDFGADLSYVDKGSHTLYNGELIHTFDKIDKQAYLITLLTNIDSVQKASLIYDNWEFAKEVLDDARRIDSGAREEGGLFADKEEKHSLLAKTDLAYIEERKTIIIDQLLLDHVKLNGYIGDLVGNFDRDDVLPTIKLDGTLSKKDDPIAIIQEMIDANRKNQEKEGYVPPDSFVLAGDGSDWEEIWDRYSPGVDILDPPDSDYDYSNLAPAIYDSKTGVPKNPIGPSNKADVYVRNALSHPIPDNNTVGVDDTKRIAVDNYIFIDTVLALESIKNRNTLRYAGMPVGKAIKEIFSQLYTWIQQAAPGHPEYERMFRFCRWYAEAVVLRNSKQILHRVYNPWQSSLHIGSGLGIDHVKHGWLHMTGTGTLDTTSLSARLVFSKENYIDSEFVLRGYFDNPAGQGTMEISVDGVVVDSFNSHGVYERRIEIPQGHHEYDIFFYGTSGAASISSIEIGGTNFVSAHTTSDDTDVNGLKALTELMAQLLGYFELHHGGRKIKGTMEVRQRAVWNTHT